MNRLIDYISQYNSITNVYGFSRSLLALGLFLTLATNQINLLIQFENWSSFIFESRYILKYSFFYIFQNNLVYAKSIALVVLFLVIIGWKPKFTVFFHWWITFSFFVSCPIVDGGDQIAAILTLLIMPIGFFDKRTWHWSKKRNKNSPYVNIVNYILYITIRIQACIIYLFAGTEKLSVPEWRNGTVLYYWFSDPSFGANDFFYTLLEPLIKSPFIAIITWGVIILEILLAMAILAEKKYWKFFLISGIIFHLFIVIIHGLFSFFFSMAALLILYLAPLNKPIEFYKYKKVLKYKFNLNTKIK